LEALLVWDLSGRLIDFLTGGTFGLGLKRPFNRPVGTYSWVAFKRAVAFWWAEKTLRVYIYRLLAGISDDDNIRISATSAD
jgi:hypothetical protein